MKIIVLGPGESDYANPFRPCSTAESGAIMRTELLQFRLVPHFELHQLRRKGC